MSRLIQLIVIVLLSGAIVACGRIVASTPGQPLIAVTATRPHITLTLQVLTATLVAEPISPKIQEEKIAVPTDDKEITKADPTSSLIPPLPYEKAVHLFDYDAQAPLDLQERSVEERNGVTVHDISYASPKGDQVTSYLVVPEGAGPFAGVILQHGLPGNRDVLLPHALDLAKTGVVALLIDAPFARPENVQRALGLTFTEQDRDEQIQLIVDLRRGVDLLTARKDVDAKRLAYIGHSYGAAMGGLLAGVEKRIKAYVLAVGDGGLVEHFTGEEAQFNPLQ